MASFKSNRKIWIFEHNQVILKWNRVVINLISLMVFGLMVMRYGFDFQGKASALWIPTIRAFYFIYAFNFVFRVALERKKTEFIIGHVFEFIVFLLILLSGISYFVFSTSHLQDLAVLFGNDKKYFEFLLLFFLLLLALIEFIKSLNFIVARSVKPATLFLTSYIVLILAGTGLLSLPGFNIKNEFLNFFDSLFVSTSAVCITGLSTIEVGKFFNLKGQIILLILIQMGGVGLLTFASFFATYIRKGIGIRQQVLMNELFNMDSLNSSFSFVKRMLFLFFGIEAVGVAAIMLSWGDYPFTSFGQKLYFSIFHVGSSFCNAGFTLFPDATKNDIINRMFVWQYIVAAVMILGGLGFPTIIDMFSIRRLRERVRITWKNWELGTKISLYSALILLVVGAVFFFYLFVNSNFQNENLIEKISISFFQSAGLRTTGLGSIDLALASQALILICMFMMFIGGGSSSLAGGIKTSTFVVAFVAIIGTIRGKKEVKLGNRSVPNELIYKAFAIIIFSANFILIVITALSFSDPNIPFLKLTFESVSAFTNTGLSMGITSTLSDAGKVIISIAMFGGRVGVLTLAFALSSKSKPNTIHYPKTHLIIG